VEYGPPWLIFGDARKGDTGGRGICGREALDMIEVGI
jgi:hypothetical protein